MTRKTKRTRDYEVSIQLSCDQFIATPRESQRNWLLNRVVKETADELDHLNEIADSFVTGVDSVGGLEDRSQKTLADEEIMEDWQVPVMKAMADHVCSGHGDVLEIGFGRGIGSDFIQSGGVRSHTIIECNDSVIERFHQWKLRYPRHDIRLVADRWQDAIGQLKKFDGIFFHTYPLNESEFIEQVVQSSTFAEHFFEIAALHLRPGGIFTYLTNEIDSLSRAHQRALLERFSSVTLSVLRNLDVPEDTRDALWANSIVIVRVVK